MNSKVCFVIVTFNSEDVIEKCLNSILYYEPYADIILIDNGSKDKTEEILKSYDSIYFIKNEVNKGFGEANNQGMKLALDRNYEFVFLLNHDAFLIEPILAKLIDVYNNSNNVGLISPFHLGESQNCLEENFEKYLVEFGVTKKLYSDRLNGIEDNVYEIAFTPAAAWLLHRDILLNFGMFNKVFFHYGEDNNYIHRLLYRKKRILVTNKAHVVHIGFKGKKNRKRDLKAVDMMLKKAQHLVLFMDPNNYWSLKNYAFSLIKDFSKIYVDFVSWKFGRGCRRLHLIYWKMVIYSTLKGERSSTLNINEK